MAGLLETPLLVRPPPHPHESWIGYYLRLSSANGAPFVTWVASALGQNANREVHSVVSEWTKPDTPARAAPLLGVSADRLNAIALTRSQEADAGRTKFSLGKLGLDRKYLRLERPQVCPLCLQKNQYAHRAWDLASVTACPEHRVHLVDTCPQCNAPLRWARAELKHCQCGFDLSLATTRYADQDEIALSQWVVDALDQGKGVWPQLAPTISHLDLSQLFELISTLTESITRSVIDVSPGLYLEQLDHQRLHVVQLAVWRSFESWPLEFFKLLDCVHTARVTELGLVAADAWLADLRSKWTMPVGELRPFEFLRCAIAAYRAAPFADAIPPEFRVNSSSQRVVGRSGAALFLGVKPEHVDTLVTRGKLARSAKAEEGHETTFDIHDLVQLRGTLSHLISVSTASKLLNLSASMVKNLIHSGLLKPWQGPTVDGYGRYRIDSREVVALLGNFSDIRLQSCTDSSLATLNYARGMLNRIGLDTSRFVHEILAGNLKMARYSAPHGLGGIRFSKAEIDRFVARRIPALEQMIPIKDIASQMGIYYEPIRQLVLKGFLQSEKRRLPHGAMCQCVSAKDVEKFREKYIFTREIGAIIGRFPVSIAMRLAAEGIRPVSGPSVDGAPVYLFERSAIKDLDWGRLMKKKVIGWPLSTSRQERQPSQSPVPGLLGTEQVARQLKTSCQKVVQLVKRGLLNCEPGSAKLKRVRFFTQAQVDQYLNQYCNNPKLVTVVEAAAILGITTFVLLRRWAWSGRLAVIDSGMGRYVAKADVQKIQRIARETVSAVEAAKMLRISPFGVVNKLRGVGIEPVSGPGIDSFRSYRYRRLDIESFSHQAY